MLVKSLLVLFTLLRIDAAPAEGPVRIALAVPGSFGSGQPLQIPTSDVAASEIAESRTPAENGLIPEIDTGLFSNRNKHRESAALENEDINSKVLTTKENFHGLFSGAFQRPKPLVDTISEEEKYGNNGDKFATIGRALVSGTETITNFITNAANVPVDFVKSITRSASASLNNLGSRLIGL